MLFLPASGRFMEEIVENLRSKGGHRQRRIEDYGRLWYDRSEEVAA